MAFGTRGDFGLSSNLDENFQRKAEITTFNKVLDTIKRKNDEQ